MEEWGWLGEDVWLAHCVHLASLDVRRIAASGAGVSWCPGSNLRLGAGIASARSLLDAAAVVGLGVDGSASNDAGDLLAEARQALLVTRGVHGVDALSVREVLRIATRGGAACLGRDDIGAIDVGKRADLALFPVDGLATAGADADPVAALVLCGSEGVRHLLVEGRSVVRDGRLATVDVGAIAEAGHRAGRAIAGRSPR
jgi:cytosine/adenosine deaminase-related metal-dependent hydrolase